MADALGLLAGALTTISFIPQLVKVWRSKSAGDISLVMFLVFSAGVALWLVYGLLVPSLPVILANGVTLALALAILCLKLRYDRFDRLIRLPDVAPAGREKGTNSAP